MQTERTIEPHWSKKHKDYMSRAATATVSVAEGAVRAGKTIDNVYAFAKQLYLGTPDRIHLATGSTVANAKLNLGDCNGFGLEYIFRGRCKWRKYRDNEALVITLGSRQYIVIFAGGAKADSFKKIRGNSYGMWIATEINLHHENTVQEAFNRQLAARNRRIYWDLNPTAPGAWIYERYIDRFQEQFGDRYNFEHFTIRDNVNITPERLEEIERQYMPGSLWYRRDILGERCNAEGLIYPMFDPDVNVTDETSTDGEYYISIDYGTMNPTVFELWRIRPDGTAVLDKEYYHDGRNDKLRGQKTNEDYYRDLVTFAGDLPIRQVIIDPSASLKVNIKNGKKFKVRDADNEVLRGIRFVGDLMQAGRIQINQSCEHTIKEMAMYCWDDAKPDDTVLKENDHCSDAMRYAIYTNRRKFRTNRQMPMPMYLY
ncbi:MAG: PBSX family phage terminase large subunit [Bacteroidales bacterium]|nr:PBSX family phage terminase large subunit [Bacteroidales bacterium]